MGLITSLRGHPLASPVSKREINKAGALKMPRSQLLLIVLLLAPLASAITLQTNLIEGSFKIKHSSAQHMLCCYVHLNSSFLGSFRGLWDTTGMRRYLATSRTDASDAYYNLWGINSTVLDESSDDDHHIEVFTLNEQGAGFSVYALVNDKPFGEQAWLWHAPEVRHSFSGSLLMASSSLVAPNTIQILNLAKADQITEIQTLRFTPAGVEKTYVASKADGGPGKTVVWKSFDERVDENGEPVQQSAPLRYVPLNFPLVYTLG